MSDIVKHLYDGSLQATDGTPTTPLSIDLAFTVGDFSMSGVAETQRNVNAYEARGVLTSVRHTSRTYVTGSFSLQLADYSDATIETAIDFYTKDGAFAAAVSTKAGGVHCTNLKLTTAGVALGDSADHTVEMTDVHVVMDFTEGEPNTLTCNYTCYGDVTFT